MSNYEFVLRGHNVDIHHMIELDGTDTPYVGMVMKREVVTESYRSMDTTLVTPESLREFGHFLIEMADAYDNVPDGVYEVPPNALEYVVKTSKGNKDD